MLILNGSIKPRPDVLVVGGGAAALCAAISARRAGVSVLLLERAPVGERGGNSRHSRNFRYVHEGSSPFSAGPYPEVEFRRDLARVAGSDQDPALLRLLIERSTDLPDWLASVGVRLQSVAGGGLPRSRKTAFLLGGGKTMLNALYATAARLGVEIQNDASVEALSLVGPAVQAVHYRLQASNSRQWQGNGKLQVVYPRASILCSGGAQADRAWLRTQCGARADGFINRGTPHATGRVLRNLLSQGIVAKGDPTAAYLVAVDARSPSDDGGIVTRVRSMHAGIVVDCHGQRHYDESADTASTRYAAWGQRLADFPGQIGYLILDRRGLQIEAPSFYSPISAPDLAALARLLDLPAATLARSLEDYNAVMPPLEPPFFAFPMRPGITFTYHGVAVDSALRVRHQTQGPIANLFAAGMLMAPNLLSRGYLSGLALMIGLATGRAAGAQAARVAASAGTSRARGSRVAALATSR